MTKETFNTWLFGGVFGLIAFTACAFAFVETLRWSAAVVAGVSLLLAGVAFAKVIAAYERAVDR